MHVEFKDLPKRMQKQVLSKLAREDKEHAAALKERRRMEQVRGEPPRGFDSRGEYEYYLAEVVPRVKSGELAGAKTHPQYTLFEAGEYCGMKLGNIRYTPDFVLEYPDGSVEVVEIKSKFVRRMQRDYPLRRRLFIEKYARPKGWKFTEVITDEAREDWERKERP